MKEKLTNKDKILYVSEIYKPEDNDNDKNWLEMFIEPYIDHLQIVPGYRINSDGYYLLNHYVFTAHFNNNFVINSRVNEIVNRINIDNISNILQSFYERNDLLSIIYNNYVDIIFMLFNHCIYKLSIVHLLTKREPPITIYDAILAIQDSICNYAIKNYKRETDVAKHMNYLFNNNNTGIDIIEKLKQLPNIYKFSVSKYLVPKQLNSQLSIEEKNGLCYLLAIRLTEKYNLPYIYDEHNKFDIYTIFLRRDDAITMTKRFPNIKYDFNQVINLYKNKD